MSAPVPGKPPARSDDRVTFVATPVGPLRDWRCCSWSSALAFRSTPDETYYWEWSQWLAPGYYDHPPATRG
jgi:hypothetical protein